MVHQTARSCEAFSMVSGYCRLENLRTASGGTAGGVAVTAKATKRTARALAFLVPLIALMKSADKLVMRKGVADWATHRQLQARSYSPPVSYQI